MIVLGIDTSTNYGSAAITDKDSLLSESSIPSTNSYSKSLISTIDKLLKRCGRSISDIDGYAVSIGPGSFTGLRIGLSTCKGFHLATGKPIIPVGTLDAMIEGMLSDSEFLQSSISLLCPIINAKKGEVYASIYRYDDREIKKVSDDMVISPEKLCRRFDEPVIFFGDGIGQYGGLINERLKGHASFFNGASKNSLAAGIAVIGGKKLERGDVGDSVILKPKYIRRSEAEIKWEEKKGGIDYDIKRA